MRIQRRDADGTSRAQRRDADGTPFSQRRDAVGTPLPNSGTLMEPPKKMQRMQKNLLHFRKQRTIFIICIKVIKLAVTE